MMAESLPSATFSSDMLQRVIETDRIYFELGAKIEPLPGAVLAWMPGLAPCPASTVVHRVDPDAVLRDGERWIAEVERQLATIGAGLARIYCDASGPADAVLRTAGYIGREEVVFIHRFGNDDPRLDLRAVETEELWDAKLSLHSAMGSSPDGHDNDPQNWVELERRKSGETMQPYLALHEGEVVGAICALWGDGLLRLKNIAIHPAYRRRSMGHAMLASLAAVGRQRDVHQQCVFAVRGSPGEAFYRALGMREVGTQIEWSKPLQGSPE